jgi:hypothetical protein|tara:strand:+ start:123 stop:935 length:813 start_codon:yes stop_codon:yes gene_type:complete
MAERKRVKGKKPKETMRQRQQRLLREQRAARNKNVRAQKALPPKATTGGRRYSGGTASSRRAQAAAKQARAAQGTKGSTVRQGQPAGAANRYFGANRVARSVRRAQLETAARRFARGAKVLGKGAARLVAGRDDGSGSALMAAMATNDAINAARGSTAKERNKKKEQPKGKVKVQKDNTTVTRKKSRDYQAERKAREAKAAKPSQPKNQQQTQKPKVKKGNGVSGVGPVASGRAYSVAKTGKSVSRQRVDELRAMRERSKKRQAAQKKKK